MLPSPLGGEGIWWSPLPRARGRNRVAAPGVVGAGDFGEVIVGQLAVGAVHHGAEFAGVDEERALSNGV